MLLKCIHLSGSLGAKAWLAAPWCTATRLTSPGKDQNSKEFLVIAFVPLYSNHRLNHQD